MACYYGRETRRADKKVALKGNGTLKMSNASADQHKCVAFSLQDLGFKRTDSITQRQPRVPVLLKHYTRCAFWMPVGTVHRQTVVIFFSYSRSFCAFLHCLTFWCDCDSALQTNHSCYFSGWISCSFPTWLKITDEKRSAGVLITKMTDSEKLRVRAFFFQLIDWLIFCWTLLKELCLKKQVWERGLLSPKNTFILARYLMPACCWHINWRTLACLLTTLCEPPAVFPCTSIFHFSFSSLIISV